MLKNALSFSQSHLQFQVYTVATKISPQLLVRFCGSTKKGRRTGMFWEQVNFYIVFLQNGKKSKNYRARTGTVPYLCIMQSSESLLHVVHKIISFVILSFILGRQCCGSGSPSASASNKNPDPHQSDKHQFAYDKPKCRVWNMGLFEHFFQV